MKWSALDELKKTKPKSKFNKKDNKYVEPKDYFNGAKVKKGSKAKVGIKQK